MRALFDINDVLAPLLRHLISTPEGAVTPQRVKAFLTELEAAGDDPAAVRRLVADHFGDLGTDVEDIARQVLRFRNAGGGADDAAFLSIDDIAKPGGDGFIIPEIDRVYKRWVSDNKQAIDGGTLDGSPENWVRNHVSTREGYRHRAMLDALLGPADLRQSRKYVTGQGSSGWRVRPRPETVPGATAVADLVGIVKDATRRDEMVERLYHARGMTDPPSLADTQLAVKEYMEYFAGRYNPLTTDGGLTPNDITLFGSTTVAHMTGGRVLHPDEFMHRVLDGYEVLNVVARANGLVNMNDLSSAIVEGQQELIKLAIVGAGGKNTHGYVFELAIILDRTINPGSDAGSPIRKIIQFTFPGGAGPDMVEMFDKPGGGFLARFVQVKSYSRASDLVGPRSEMLRQTGSDLRRTWKEMLDTDKDLVSGPLRVKAPPAANTAPEWSDLMPEAVYSVDRDRLISRFQSPPTEAGVDALRAAEEGQLTGFLTQYNTLLADDGPLTNAAKTAILDGFDRSVGRTGLRSRDVLQGLINADENMTVKKLAIARMIMDDKGEVDRQLLERLAHSDTPPIQFEVDFRTPNVQPNCLQTDVRAAVPAAAP
ncbi:hypothetical protein [Tropicimonas marinistellae]|uniref:hypothetical protein n=1 Tax=Tropicimonas marinistellae TaxID=1739787 RepID=UPI00083336E6|nr:hypothetical protein [Tropicimonas marinistellae]